MGKNELETSCIGTHFLRLAGAVTVTLNVRPTMPLTADVLERLLHLAQ